MITQRHLQGHWQREWIKAPGFEDHSTRVHWLQAGALFADLRIPLNRPKIAGVSCLADLPPKDLRRLMDAEGFAGHISVKDDKCTWHREINWHGLPGQADIGLMSFDADGGLIEDGVLAEYRELWQAVPGSVVCGSKLSGGSMTGFLIENDTTFLLAVGPPPAGTREDLIVALDSGQAQHPALAAHFDSVYILGQWDGDQGIGILASNPFYEGQVVLERGATLIWRIIAFDGSRTAASLQVI
ncbi:MAG: hypothetical protein ABJK03_04450 [Paracoccaceae bacterium]